MQNDIQLKNPVLIPHILFLLPVIIYKCSIYLLNIHGTRTCFVPGPVPGSSHLISFTFILKSR